MDDITQVMVDAEAARTDRVGSGASAPMGAGVSRSGESQAWTIDGASARVD